MKKYIGLIILIFLVIAGKKGVTLFKKFRHAQRLKIGVSKFKLLNISSTIQSNIVLNISNFSNTTFALDQINIDVYTPTGELLAKQVSPLKAPLFISPNQNTTLPIIYKINAPILISEIKKQGGITSVLANFLTSGKKGIPLILKGFIVSGMIEKSINETLTV